MTSLALLRSSASLISLSSSIDFILS
jgi:hypothetical protein